MKSSGETGNCWNFGNCEKTDFLVGSKNGKWWSKYSNWLWVSVVKLSGWHRTNRLISVFSGKEQLFFISKAWQKDIISGWGNAPVEVIGLVFVYDRLDSNEWTKLLVGLLKVCFSYQISCGSQETLILQQVIYRKTTEVKNWERS